MNRTVLQIARHFIQGKDIPEGMLNFHLFNSGIFEAILKN
ncbi:hypothetical protein NUACC26_045330 [Scytonema sp. NUACC26]